MKQYKIWWLELRSSTSPSLLRQPQLIQSPSGTKHTVAPLDLSPNPPPKPKENSAPLVQHRFGPKSSSVRSASHESDSAQSHAPPPLTLSPTVQSQSEGRVSSSTDHMQAIEADTLKSLQPKQWLNSSAIYQIQATCVTGDCYIVDPLLFDAHSLASERFARRDPLDESITRVLVPHLDPKHKHWRLAYMDKHQNTGAIYDSYQSLHCMTDWPQLKDSMQALGSRWPDFEVISRSCPDQGNTCDCGVYVVMDPLYLMA